LQKYAPKYHITLPQSLFFFRLLGVTHCQMYKSTGNPDVYSDVHLYSYDVYIIANYPDLMFMLHMFHHFPQRFWEAASPSSLWRS